MGTVDITRWLDQPEKHEVGARLQRGRVVTDADFNERHRTELSDERATLVDLIGPAGTPDDGFRVFDLQVEEIEGQPRLDFSLGAGAMYMGGVRFELDQIEQARFQGDALQLQPEELLARPILAPGQMRTDLIYLEGVEEIVTAREDRELLETALGGQDTSARVRASARVRVLADVGDVSCEGALEILSDAVFDACRYRIDRTTSELSPVEESLQLMVEEVAVGGVPADCPPCVPDPQGPFLGADHRAIRVMVSADARAFTWGFDNGGPLYRVSIDALGTVTFLDRPLDVAHYPRAGEVVEVLGWARLLSNAEKVATDTGVMTRAETAFDPLTGQMKLEIPVPQSALVTSWTGHPRESSLPGPEGLTYYLRVWSRGPIGSDLPEPLLPIQAGVLVPLGSTGIGVRWTASRGCPGDYWVIAHRPGAEPRTLPWALSEEPVPAFGPSRYVTPLALVTWRREGGEVIPRARDCRRRFGPLTCPSTCCVLTVGGEGGPGAGSYSTVQAAIDALPSEGGRICVLPGEYVGRFVLRDRTSVEIVGCGVTSRLLASRQGEEREPLGFICDSSRVRIADLMLIPGGIAGIQVNESAPGHTQEISLERLRVQSTRSEAEDASPKAAIEIVGGERVNVRRCQLEMPRGDPSLHPLVLLSGRRVTLSECMVECTGVVPGGRRAWGGVQIGGDAMDVSIERCEIRGGFGHGITLGSIVYETGEPTSERRELPVGCAAMSFDQGIDPRLSLEVIRVFGTGPGSAQPQSGGVLEGVLIRGNLIEDQGGSGVASAAFWPLQLGRAPEVILGVSSLRIEDNRIRRCFMARPLGLPGFTGLVAAGGGICLGDADGVEIRGNVIDRCAEGGTGCGVFAVQASDATIERNLIQDVGTEGATGVGAKGGIVLYAVLPSVERTDSIPQAARIVGNRVLQPAGKALQVTAISGALIVASNHLSSCGDEAPGPSLTATSLQVQAGRVNDRSGLTVDLFNAGLGYDVASLLGVSDPQLFDDGRILFSHNQVRLTWTNRAARGPFLASVSLQGLDEVAVVGNELSAKLDRPASVGASSPSPAETLGIESGQGDRLLTQLYAVALTLKIDQNRIEEGVADALVSALGIGILPISTMARLNHATHCVVAGSPGVPIADPSRVLNHVVVDPPAPSDPTRAFCDSGRVCINPLPGADPGRLAFQVELDCVTP